MPASVLKETFFKISKKKQDHIMKCALKEFAKGGLSGTNILDIAKRAKISVGSLYTYVDSKDELYVAVAENIVNQMIKEFDNLEFTGTFMENVCLLFEAVSENARKQTDHVRFYFDMMTEMVTPKIKDVTYRLECRKYEKYMELVEKAIDSEELRDNIDKNLLAFILDSYLQTFQLALTTTHYKNKSKIYFGTSNPEDLGQMICDHFELSIARIIYKGQ